jgi:hypothetical protein
MMARHTARNMQNAAKLPAITMMMMALMATSCSLRRAVAAYRDGRSYIG